jgi:intergrase/recombinase
MRLSRKNSQTDKETLVKARAGLPMRVKQLRSFYATKMRELCLLSEQIDLVQGRVGKSIFLQHYFKQDAQLLSSRSNRACS